MASLHLSRLTPQQRKDLVTRLHEAQGGLCFICETAIDVDVQGASLDIDHVEPISLGGKDDKTNFALTHDSCNRSKQASDLRIARVLARFAHIQEAVRAAESRGANLSDILSRYAARGTNSDSSSRTGASSTAMLKKRTTHCGRRLCTPIRSVTSATSSQFCRSRTYTMTIGSTRGILAPTSQSSWLSFTEAAHSFTSRLVGSRREPFATQ
jgi:HNH endonuclease